MSCAPEHPVWANFQGLTSQREVLTCAVQSQGQRTRAKEYLKEHPLVSEGLVFSFNKYLNTPLWEEG